MRSELGWEVRSLKLTSASFFFFQVPDGGFAVRFFFFRTWPGPGFVGYLNVRSAGVLPTHHQGNNHWAPIST